MRIAVVGAGRMGAIRVEDLAADPRVTDIVVLNRGEERGRELAARFGGRFAPWSALGDLDADGTVVAVATDAHGPALDPVLAGGRPVLCEKPIALTLAGTQAVIDRAAATGTPLQIGFQRRFDPGIADLQRRVAAGEVGTIYSLALTAHDHTPSPRAFIAGSGGIFRDMHVHDFDLVRWITGSEVVTVFATSAVREHHQYAEFDDADVATIVAVTENGVQVSIRGARHDALGHDVRMEVQGSLDSVAAGLNRRTPLHATDGTLELCADPYTGFVDRFREAFRRETRAFVDLVSGVAPNPCPPDSALESLRIAIACEKAVATRAPVAVRDVAGP